MKIHILISISCLLFISALQSRTIHPILTLTKSGLADIRKNINKAPIFKESYIQIKSDVDEWVKSGVNVPVPKDMAGGYTHEVHKRNFLMLQAAGNVYQISGDKSYALHIKKVFQAYAAMYPTLGKHPAMRSYARGKIFWQCLNDANWMVYASQAYDCIYETLSKSERDNLETNLFRPFADFISIENPSFFNRIHNHSTWGNAAVGMIALVMEDDSLLKRALYGISGMGAISGVDNDGGTIDVNQSAGFLAQLDEAFSPDGYYSEGPYYERYAMSPFILFSQALANAKPELHIFQYRDHLLKKALTSLLNMTDSKGRFFPINDAQKGMSYQSRELVAAVNAIYFYEGQDKALLSIAESQGKVQLDQTGLAVASAIAEHKSQPFVKNSMLFSDGPKGNGGAVSVLRQNVNGFENACFFKYGIQGMGHGHFDRLSYSLYQNKNEILQDYGAARWVNIDQKAGGVYLKENQSWAKQTIAHNTVVVNESSQFGGNTQRGDLYPSQSYYFDVSNPNIQIASAVDTNAYKGVSLHRTLCFLPDESFDQSMLIDIFAVDSDTPNNLDLPFHFGSQLMTSSVDIVVPEVQLKTLGKTDGYQHLWKEGHGIIDSTQYIISWFTNGVFTTQYSLAEKGDEIIFARIGANDSNFNLRRDPLFIHRKRQEKNALFINVISSHGNYNPVDEVPINSYGPKVMIDLLLNNDAYTIAKITTGGKNIYTVMISNKNNTPGQSHSVSINDVTYNWKNAVSVQKIKI